MRRWLVFATGMAVVSVLLPACGGAAEIVLSTPFVVPGERLPSMPSPTLGISFVYSGILTGADTLGLTASGSVAQIFYHSTFANAAGVTTSEYPGGVPGVSNFGHATGVDASGFNVDALLLSISGVGEEQLFQPTAANGLGGLAAMTTLTLSSTSLTSLGFGSFSITNPTLTFRSNVASEQYAVGNYTITQSAAPASVPEVASAWLVIAGLASATVVLRSARGAARRS